MEKRKSTAVRGDWLESDITGAAADGQWSVTVDREGGTTDAELLRFLRERDDARVGVERALPSAAAAEPFDLPGSRVRPGAGRSALVHRWVHGDAEPHRAWRISDPHCSNPEVGIVRETDGQALDRMASLLDAAVAAEKRTGAALDRMTATLQGFRDWAGTLGRAVAAQGGAG